MYEGGLHCLSFRARKPLPIGRGGMILTDDAITAAWLRKARACGRDGSVPYAQDRIDMIGWCMDMTPEQAARGMMLLDAMGDDLPDKVVEYPDLREMPAFAEAAYL
jgi:dTDP-4-amino-4,6-dideoxygalactose transaminase